MDIIVAVDYPSYPGFSSPKVEPAALPLMRKVPKIEPSSAWKGAPLTQDPYQLFGQTSHRLATSGIYMSIISVIIVYHFYYYCLLFYCTDSTYKMSTLKVLYK